MYNSKGASRKENLQSNFNQLKNYFITNVPAASQAGRRDGVP